jgi:hypothetical protein
MSKYGTWHLAAMITALVGCAGSDEVRTANTEQGVAGTDTLFSGEGLAPGQAISQGNTALVYQGDDNLVLYQNGNPIWASMAGLGIPAGSFQMQGDCNAVVYSQSGPVWSSGTNGRGSNCFARVIEGDWFICNGTNREFTARGGGSCGSATPPPPPPPPSGGYAGCFTDDQNRALPVFQGGGFSIQACLDTCRNQGFVYAGSQFFDQCFCGNTVGYNHVSDAECDTPCTSGGGFCGGAWRNSIRATGASSGPRCGDGVCEDGEGCACARDCGACSPDNR